MSLLFRSWITPPCLTCALLRWRKVLFFGFRHTLFTFFALVAAIVSLATYTRCSVWFGRPPRYPGVVFLGRRHAAGDAGGSFLTPWEQCVVG
jgi:hypothetical protein